MLVIYSGILQICVSAALFFPTSLRAGYHRLFIWHLGDGDVIKHQIACKHLARLAGVNVDH